MLNVAVIMGRLAADPEVRLTPNGLPDTPLHVGGHSR